MSALMIAPFLGKSFENFISLITLINIEKLRKDNDLRIMISGQKRGTKQEMIPKKFFAPLIDKMNLPIELGVDTYLKNQNYYYLITSYQELGGLLNKLELNNNLSLSNLLVFLTSSPMNKDMKEALDNTIEKYVPKKFKNNIISSKAFKLSELKELCIDFLKDTETKMPVPKEKTDTFEFVFFDSESHLDASTYDYFYSLNNIDYLFVLPNRNNFEITRKFLDNLDKDKIKIRDIYVQSDPMDFESIAGLITLDGCKKVVHIDQEYLVSIK